MRNIYRYICSSLLLMLSAMTFADDTTDCAARIPNSPNFIISGAIFRETIQCLENLIEARHASIIAAIQAQSEITVKKNEEQKAERQKNESKKDAQKKDLQKEDDLLSNVSIPLKAKPHAKNI